ncbi:MAG: TonB-dependent receptor plug domain-containing protein [Gemmatimonadota bacterium]
MRATATRHPSGGGHTGPRGPVAAPPRRRARLLSLALAASLLTGRVGEAQSPARAISELTGLSLEELMEVEVTLATRRPQKLSHSAAAITVVSGDELRRAGARTLPDALRLVPGLQVAQIDANKWIVTARGFAGLFSNQLLVLLDGRSIYTPLFSGVFWESQDVLMEDVERIEIIRGPGGALWGANAVNGIVNIITRQAEQTQGGYVQTRGSSEGHEVAARYGGRDGRGWYRVYGKVDERSPSAPAGPRPVRDGMHMARGGFRTDVDLSESDRLTVLGNAFRGAVGQSLNLVLAPPPSLGEAVYFDAEVRGADLLARWQRRLGEFSQVEAQASYDGFDREEIMLRGRLHNANLDLQHTWSGGRQRLAWGAGYRRTWDEFEGSFTMRLEPPRRTTHLFSAFVHDDLELWPERLRASLGTKVEHNSYSGFEWQPSVALWGSPAPRQSAWLSVSRPVRTPSRGDEDLKAIIAALPGDALLPGSPVTLVMADNSRDFTAERVLSVDAGYRLGLGARWYADVAAYYSRRANNLSQEPGLPRVVPGETLYWILPLETDNLARATATGLDMALEWQVSSTWQLRAVYSYLDFDIGLSGRSRDVTTESNEDESPRHQLGLRSLSESGPWSLAVTARWVSALLGPGIPDYATADVRLSRRLGHGFEVALAGYDLLEASHREAVSQISGSAPTRVERELAASASWRF